MNDQKSIFIHMIEILESIDTDLMIPLRLHEKENRGGFFSISRQVFCYIDYLGALSYGVNHTNNAVRFMNKYFAAVNPKYSGKCEILYKMWRHGTVHQFAPKIYKSEISNFKFHWGANNTSLEINRKWHLDCFCRDKKPGYYNWFINLFELVEDLKKSIKIFICDLESDISYFKKVKNNYEKLSRYIILDQDNNLRSILSEAEDIIKNTAGVIDDHGNVKPFIKDRASEFEKFKREEWK